MHTRCLWLVRIGCCGCFRFPFEFLSCFVVVVVIGKIICKEVHILGKREERRDDQEVPGERSSVKDN